MQRTSRQFTISMPPEMAEQILAQAKRENRTISELFRDYYRAYRGAKIRQILDESQAETRAHNPMGYTEDDVVRLVKEVRREMAAEREAEKAALAG